ncbi:MAG: hypothetical protein U5M23_13010 [Marinagarivorans sp.]|nr:hypothetical protein [Marinagarivorans sp.]
MFELNLEGSTAKFPFKEIKSKSRNGTGTRFRQTQKNSDGTGLALEVSHSAGDYLTLDFRSMYRKKSGGIGEKRLLLWSMDAKTTVAFASILMCLADEKLRDSAELAYSIITTKEKVEYGNNWINEEYNTAIARTEKRKARSHLYGLMRRCIETSENNDFMQHLLINLAAWAEQSGDGYSIQMAEKAIAQMGLIPKALVN